MATWTTTDIPDQSGRTIAITGANVGLGLESAKALAARGARVILACRNPDRGGPALAEVAAAATGAAPTLVRLDLGDLASVASAAADIAGQAPRLDVLMNNAGVMAIPKRSLTADGFETQFGVNHLGHFALTLRLLPQLLATGSGPSTSTDAPVPTAAPTSARVVALGSLAHLRGKIHLDDLNLERGYTGWGAYDQSKLANVMFALELDKRAKAARLPVIGVSAHPGLSKTNLFSAGPKASGFNPAATVMKYGVGIIGQSPKRGALGQLRAATDPEVQGSEYFGPAGFQGWSGSPVLAPTSKRALDDTVSAALWDASERLVGLTLADAAAAATA